MVTIMVVDDESQLRELIKKILEREKFNVLTAADGKECLDILKSERPDLILLDVMMPGINGWEVCKELKDDAKTRNIPVAMFTVRRSEEDMKKSLEYAHADAHISKPYRRAELLKVIDEILGESVSTN